MHYADTVTAMVAHAARDEESFSLAGISPDDLLSDEERAAGIEPPLTGYAELEKALRDGLAELARLRSHSHVWDYGNSESDPVRCSVCGADGLA